MLRFLLVEAAQVTARSLPHEDSSRFSPLSRTSPLTRADTGNSRSRLSPTVVLPDPDSPARPSTCWWTSSWTGSGTSG